MVLAFESDLLEVDGLVRSLDFASGFFRATLREDGGAVSLARIQVVKSLSSCTGTVEPRNFHLTKWYRGTVSKPSSTIPVSTSIIWVRRTNLHDEELLLNRPSYEERAMWTTSGSWTAAATATSVRMTCRATWWPPSPSPGSPGWSWTRTAHRRRPTVGAGGYW